MEGWRRAADETGLEIHVEGLPSLNHFSFSYDNSAELMTLFIQEMLAKGFLAYGQFKPSYAHRQEHVESYLRATEETFAEIAESVAKGDTAKRLRGPVMKTGFYRLVR